ncbi:MAG: hypothetical protein ACOY4T_01750 [Pseudomonadota bacterium]|jgi:hypothetical protein
MTGAPALSLAIAVQGAQANLPDIVGALPADSAGQIEVLICHASDDPLPAFLPARPGLRTVPGRPGALIPELWRDGFLAARAGWVATLTAHCPPRPDWYGRALSLVAAADPRAAAFGGAIVAAEESDRVTRAIHLLRYADAGPVAQRRAVHDLSADNAIYRRAAVLDCAGLLPDGFWEPNYHRRFRAAGLTLEMVPDLVVLHRNRYSARGFMAQRRRHGRVFGRHRSEGRTAAARAALLAASPLALPVFALKQTRKILSRPDLRAQGRGALGLFYLFLANWCLGEMAGYADALARPRRDRA